MIAILALALALVMPIVHCHAENRMIPVHLEPLEPVISSMHHCDLHAMEHHFTNEDTNCIDQLLNLILLKDSCNPELISVFLEAQLSGLERESSCPAMLPTIITNAAAENTLPLLN